MRHLKASSMNNGTDSTNQLPNQLPIILQNHLVTNNNANNAGPSTNGNPYIVTNGSAANASSTTSVSTWLQNNPVGSSGTAPWSIQTQAQNQYQIHNSAGSGTNMAWHTQSPVGSSRTTPWHMPYPNHRSVHEIMSVNQTPQSSNPVASITTANGTHNNFHLPTLPHPLHFHTYGAPSASSSAVMGHQQNNNNAQGGSLPTKAVKNITIRVSTKRAKAASTDTVPKKPRGRPKKVTTAVSQSTQAIVQYPTATVTSATAISSAIGTTFNIRPAAFATMPSTAVPALFGPSMALSSMPATSGMPSTSLSSPSQYVPPMNYRPTLTAAMPVPPNWLANMEDSVMSLLTFNKYEIREDTAEYQTISDMLYPIAVKGVEQIVNPDLWDRFVKTRTDMMRSKADDLNILSKLGLSDKEVLRCAHLSLNFRKDPLLIPYSDNMVLLYHCTRNQSNVNSILTQGLDERLSSTSAGLLGKGIYFADDPNKSIQYDGTGYIFIFAVLLGDCISVDHFTNQRSFVREPEKVSQQKRNFNDHFFDSIVARPAGHNEYVIYNRYQCCPIYQVKYDRNTVAGGSASTFQSSSQKLPPIAWIPSGQNYAMPIQDQTIHWPFFAMDLFTSMGVSPPTDEDGEDGNNDVAQNMSQKSIDDNLASLINLGFNDEAKNREILAKFNNDLDRAVNYYLENGNTEEDVAVNDPEATTIQDNSVNTSATSEMEMLANDSADAVDADQSIILIDLSSEEESDTNDDSIVVINDDSDEKEQSS
ncbi:hypothetical protein HA402_005318 [Bradysia odoriphaga]|nr:hypothetical protein HA402_005318 [Bradysia odoriphaga]